MENVDHTQEKMDYVSSAGNFKKESKGNVRCETPVTEIKNAFYGLIGRLDTAEEFLSLRI